MYFNAPYSSLCLYIRILNLICLDSYSGESTFFIAMKKSTVNKIWYEGYLPNEKRRYFFTCSLKLALKEQRIMFDAGVKIDISKWQWTIDDPPLLLRTWFVDDNGKVCHTKD